MARAGGRAAAAALLAMAVLALVRVDAYNQLHLCNGSGRRYCANTHRAVRCPQTCRPENCVKRPVGKDGAYYTRCYQIRPPICQTIYWEEIAATNMYDYVFLNTTMDQDLGEICMSTCREEPFRGICLASERGVNGVDYCKQVDCRRLKTPNQSGCHQPRDFHAPTCFECELLWPLACGSDAGGVLKGWKRMRSDIEKAEKLKSDILYNASVLSYANIMQSTYDDVYRWLNGTAVPRVPDWYTCSKINNDRTAFMENLKQQLAQRYQTQQWQAGRDTPLPAGVAAALLNGTYGGDVTTELDNSDAASPQAPQGSQDTTPADLVSSEGLPYSGLWYKYSCKNFYPDDLIKKYDNRPDSPSDFSGPASFVVDGIMDWLPPWHWEPWNQDWKPLPGGMRWWWELVEEAELKATMQSGGIQTDTTIGPALLALDRDAELALKTTAFDTLTTSDMIAIDIGTASDVSVKSGTAPKIVNVVFQVADTEAHPFVEDDEGLKKVLAFVANEEMPPSDVTIMDVYRDLTQELVTISAAISTEDPVGVSVAFAKADRTSRFAAALAAANFEYLEVSLTTTAGYTPTGLYDKFIDESPADSTGEALGAVVVAPADGRVAAVSDGNTLSIVAGAAAAVVVACIIGLVILVVVLRKRKAAAAESAADIKGKAPGVPELEAEADEAIPANTL